MRCLKHSDAIINQNSWTVVHNFPQWYQFHWNLLIVGLQLLSSILYCISEDNYSKFGLMSWTICLYPPPKTPTLSDTTHTRDKIARHDEMYMVLCFFLGEVDLLFLLLMYGLVFDRFYPMTRLDGQFRVMCRTCLSRVLWCLFDRVCV